MKMFNHKTVLNMVYGATTPLSVDPQDRGISPKMIKDILEILKDCDCVNCQKVSQGFLMADRLIELGDYNSASIALSVASESLGALTIPAKLVLN